MAVRALPRTRARAPLEVATVQPAILLLALIPPLLDLLAVVQPGTAAPNVGLVAAGVASAALVFTWGRFWRTSWLAAASLAAVASLALRFAGVDGAPAFSLLVLLALGVGGAFASAPTGWLDPFELG